MQGSGSEGTFLLGDATFQLFEGFPGPLSSDLDAHWHLHFNRVDWEFGRSISLGSDFVIRPLFGIEGVWITQKVREWINTTFTELNEGFATLNKIEIENKNRFFGVGSKGGFSGLFKLGKGFAFQGQFAGNVLWGGFRIRQGIDQTNFFVDGQSANLGSEAIHHSHYASVFNLDVGLVLSWSHLFEKSGRSLMIKCGWEQHFYTNMDRFQNFYVADMVGEEKVFAFDRNVQRGNLTLSGFSFGVAVNY